MTDELSRCVDALLSCLDESWYFASARALHDFSDLCDGLLQDVGRTYVDLGDNDHDWHVESKGNTQMLLAHANKTVVGCYHKQAVVGAT